MDHKILEKIRTYLDEVVLHKQGFECLLVEWDASGKILRIFIDKFAESSTQTQTQIDMNDCVVITRLLNSYPEDKDKVQISMESEFDKFLLSTGAREFRDAYHLEISSPGIERPLRTLAHFKLVMGKKCQIELLKAHEKRLRAQGVLCNIETASTSENDSSSTHTLLTLDLGRGETWQFPFDLLKKANLIYDWNLN